VDVFHPDIGLPALHAYFSERGGGVLNRISGLLRMRGAHCLPVLIVRYTVGDALKEI
jgi:hypothetical protein